MPNAPLLPFTSSYVMLLVPDIDTDQIIPARFLKTTERSGLGSLAFHDWRYNGDGTPRASFALNQASAVGAQVLVAGRNFGCGSSREHAVWALLAAGFRAVVSTSFADIFRGNALGNGLLPIQVSSDIIERLASAAESAGHASASPHVLPRVAVDLDTTTLRLPDGSASTFPIPPFARHCLMQGIDELDYLLGAEEEISAYEATHHARVDTMASDDPMNHHLADAPLRNRAAVAAQPVSGIA
jgi:3-isopropylmalate/(R)-2-methylmalate dehydratase small subunit